MRRPSTSSLVMPSSVNLKWRVGSSNGELMIGFSMTTWVIVHVQDFGTLQPPKPGRL